MPIQQSQPLYKQAYDEIKRLILSGEIETGSKIKVAQLADEYKISRTPLREALRQLEKEGLLIQDQTGTTVINLSKKDFEELCLCRLILEREVVKLAVKEATPSVIQEAERLVDEAEQLIKTNDDKKQLLELNARFHEVLIHSISNQNLIQLLDRVRALLILYRATILYSSSSVNGIIHEHRKIVEAIKKADEENAVKAIEEHLKNDRIRGLELL